MSRSRIPPARACRRPAPTAARATGTTVHEGGTYLAMEGPQFSSLAESKLYREVWHCDVIGMTNMPEAKLAREAELCYASIAMVTDYDSWHPQHGAVDIADIIATLSGNAEKARSMLAQLPGLLGGTRAPCPHGCDRALDNAMLTAPDKRDPAMVEKLSAVAGRVLGGLAMGGRRMALMELGVTVATPRRGQG